MGDDPEPGELAKGVDQPVKDTGDEGRELVATASAMFGLEGFDGNHVLGNGFAEVV